MRVKSFAGYAWGVVGFNLAVILWGAYVRASGSGAGCGAHWPLCNGEVIPRSPELKTLVELTHRLTSGLALLLVVGLVVWAYRAYAKGDRTRRAAVASLFFILLEALIGAGLVLFEYVAENESVARAAWMAVHLLNTFLLLASLALTAWWGGLSDDAAPVRLRRQGALGATLAAAFAGTALLAMSGAVAALGDTLFPAGSLSEGLRQDLSPAAHLFIRLRVMHPLLALLVGAQLLFASSYVNRARPGAATGRLSGALAALVFAQLLVGALNVGLLAPVWLQLVHLLLADLLWLALVLLAASALSAEAPARAQAEPATEAAAAGN